MLFYNEQRKQFNQAIKNQDMKAALIVISEGYQTSVSQDIKMFELIDNNKIFEVMDQLAQEARKIPDKYLALASIYWNAEYFWDIGHGTDHIITEVPKYSYLSKIYQEKVMEPGYERTLFVEWKRLFQDMILETTQYRDRKNISKFYYSPHDYEEHVIERTAFSLCNVLFKQATKAEILDTILQCQHYPKKPKAVEEIDKLYNIQNSRYYDVQYLSGWLSENAFPLTLIKKENIATIDIPLVSQGVINEIKIFYIEIDKDKKLLEPQDNFLFEKLYNQRLPELLNEYQGIDKDYAYMTNRNNKNASELLYNSLLEIRAIFETFNEKVNIKKVENLSFGLKMTKEFIKHAF